MPRYLLQHSYAAQRSGENITSFGPWAAGAEVELTAEDAEWINRDSPGALAPKAAKPEQKPVEPPKDRQRGRGR